MVSPVITLTASLHCYLVYVQYKKLRQMRHSRFVNNYAYSEHLSQDNLYSRHTLGHCRLAIVSPTPLST